VRSDRPLHTRILFGMIAGALLGMAANALWGDSPALAQVIAWVTVPLGRLFLVAAACVARAEARSPA